MGFMKIQEQHDHIYHNDKLYIKITLESYIYTHKMLIIILEVEEANDILR